MKKFLQIIFIVFFPSIAWAVNHPDACVIWNATESYFGENFGNISAYCHRNIRVYPNGGIVSSNDFAFTYTWTTTRQLLTFVYDFDTNQWVNAWSGWSDFNRVRYVTKSEMLALDRTNLGTISVPLIALDITDAASGTSQLNWMYPNGCSDLPCDLFDADHDGVNSCEDCNDSDPNKTTGYSCYTALPDDHDQGAPPDKCPGEDPSYAGNPINITNGNKYESHRDLAFPTPHQRGLTFSRSYNSQSSSTGILGFGWTHNYDVRLTSNYLVDGITHIRIVDPTGRGVYFTEGVGNRWDGALSEKSYVIAETDSTYTWHRLDGSLLNFDSQGYLRWEDNSFGNRQTTTFVSGLLQTVADEASGRTLTFYYNGNLLDHIEGPATSAVPDGIWASYGYDGNNNLTSVTYADGSGFVYEYAEPGTADNQRADDFHNLTAKKEIGPTQNYQISTWKYDDQDRAYSNTNRDGKGVTIDYQPATPDTVDVTDAYGKLRTYSISKVDGLFPKVTDMSGPGGCTSCAGDKPVHYAYDTDLNVTEEEYANGSLTTYAGYDSRGNPQTVTLAAGSSDALTKTYTYHPEMDVPLTETMASVLGVGNRETVWDYDNDGNTTPNEAPTRLVHRTIEKGFTRDAVGDIVSFEYVTSFQYNGKGQLISIDGPLPGTQDTTTFDYDPNNGNLLSVTLPGSAGAITYQNYDAAGNAGTVLDENNNQATLGYDGRNRLTTYEFGGATRSLTYEDGKLKESTDLTGLLLTYSYDPTYGRLEKITDRLNNYLHHGYDGQGNVEEESVYSAEDDRLRYQGYDYQEPVAAPGRLWKIINPDATETVYGYDQVGNVNSVQDAALKTTGYTYDMRSRLKRIDQPGDRATLFDYDPQGNLTSVTDPKGNTTYYEYDDLGRVLSVNSPDSGVTTYRYDLVNNVVTVTDANGIVSTRHNDALGRQTAITFPDTSQDLSFTYDQGTNGKNRLTGMTDQSGTTTYTNNDRGQLSQESKVIDSVNYTTAYGYDTDTVNLETITYPSNLIVTYQRDTDGHITGILADGQPVIENVTYLPFGGVEDYTFTNGPTHDRSFDQRYQVEHITSGSMDYAFLRNAVGNVEQISGKLAPTLAAESKKYLDYALDSNKLDTVTESTVKQYTQDNHGNITANGDLTFVYNQNNRLIRVKQGETVLADYVYDALGRRVKKVTSMAATVYHYDLDGNLLAETLADGTPLRDYIYLEGECVVFKNYGVQAGIYYVLNDHLATPQMVLSSTGQTLWQAAYFPYGQADVQVATIEFNLRFPGQYYDAETGLHYNLHRYYDPQIGRYLTPDPIGLDGGNLFAYVEGNPVNLDRSRRA